MRSPRRRQRRPLFRLVVATATTVALAASGLSAPTSVAEQALPGWPAVPRTKSVPGTGVPVSPRPADPAVEHAVTSVPAVSWPKAGTAEVAVSHTAARVGETAVSVSAAADGPDRVRVEVLDRSAAQRAGVEGVLFRVRQADSAQKAGPVSVDVDYSGFRHAYGGDYAARLALVRLPACAAWAPERPECVTGTPVAAHNDLKTGHLRGEVTVSGAPRAKDPEDARAGREPAPLFAVTATPSGSAGSFKPTSLSPSAMWEVGLQSGDFTWAYPLDLPPVPGPEPRVALSYSSGGIDGRTAATNNQSSWIGDGFDFQPGFIERQYTSCAGTGDLCYATANAVVSLPGVTGELVFDATKGIWRAEEDDGWRVEQLFGAANGDNDGEYWQLTAPDGTRYLFGRSADARSAWTVPVFGDDAGEPCKAASFGVSWCQQGYRWMLDQVVDRHGDIVKYFYDTETNHYGRNNTASLATPYVRGGQLNRIDYGLREGQSEPAARVVFTAADRCVPGSACQRTTTADWPDVPWDQQCDGGVCTGRLSPVFFGTKRLAKITAQVRDGANLRDVDSWTLNHLFPSTGDTTSPSLWLESIVHTGHVDGTATMPEVNFDGQLRDNRVEAVDGQPRMSKWRISRVNTETGGRIDVTYGPVGCAPGGLPAADVNGTSCFPAHWMPQGASAPVLDWFHKYLVTEVREVDRVGGSPDEVTSYEYSGDAAWHHDDAELVPDELKTWGQWRGYQSVKVRTGEPAKPRTLVEHRFHRGMDGDRNADGTTKSVTIGATRDVPALRGFAYEEITYNGDGGPVVVHEITEPEVIGPNAVRHRASGDLAAYVTEVKKTHVRTALAGGGFRETEERHSYDGYGVHVRTEDLGDLAVPDDDTCTRVEYTRNLDVWLIATPKRVVKTSRNCSVEDYAPGDVISDERTYYDGSDEFGAQPVKGDPTREEELSGWDGGTPLYSTVERSVYDAHGREVEEFDALGNKETTAYTPAVGGPVTSVTSTNALGHTESTTFRPATGDPLEQVDENGRRTTMSYDPLGRLTKVWQPGRSRDDVPDVEFEYLLRDDAPSAVVAKKLLGDGGQVSSYTLYDGLLRERQVQAPAPDGGRVVTDTRYDSHGRVARTNAPYHNPDPPGTDLLAVADQDVPAQTAFAYDGAGREVVEALLVDGTEKWRTTTTYGGNWVSEDPPEGGIATTELLDAENRVVELRQYKSGSPSGDYDATRYTFTKAGEPETITDPAGNTWRNHYDVRGRLVRVDDPDQGTSTMTYDDEDQLVTSTNSRGITLTHTYDALGRKTATHEGGTKLLEWTFDTLGKGLPVAETRFVDGQAYRDEVLGYDDAGRPTGNALTVPAREGPLAGRYESTLTYNAADQVTSVSLPAMGGLPAEKLEQGYDRFGNADSLTGLSTYVEQTLRTNLGEVGLYVMGSPGKQAVQAFEYEHGTRRLVGAAMYQEHDATPVVDRRLEYDPAGNVTKLVNASSGRPVDTQCFRVDHLRRLTEAWTAPWSCEEEPRADALGGPAPYWHSYTYDAIGNRLTEVRHGAAGDTTRTYDYPRPGSKQLAAVRTSRPGAPEDVRSFAHDAEGNVTARGGQTLSYDAEGHVTSVVEGDKTTSFTYDADGDRLIRRDPGGTTLYIGDTELHADKVGLVTATRYYEHNEETIAVRTRESLTWLSTDHHDTAETSLDADSLTAHHRLRLPFGADREEKPAAWVGDRGFVGGTEDPSTGLTHLGAREYDPETGRFLSVDPIIDEDDPQQLHGYLYSNNNPLTFSDPDGLLWGWVKKAAKVVAAVSEVASYIPGPIGTAAGLAGAAAHAALGNKKKALEMAAGAAASLVPGGKLLLKAGMAVAKKVTGKVAAKTAAAKGAAQTARTTAATAKPVKTRMKFPVPQKGRNKPLITHVGKRLKTPAPGGKRKDVSKSRRDDVHDSGAGYCGSCGDRTVPSKQSKTGGKHRLNERTIGHPVPVSRGGKNSDDLFSQCRRCQKGVSKGNDMEWSRVGHQNGQAAKKKAAKARTKARPKPKAKRSGSKARYTF
ncbi:RHS repeat-associated core domain-containing protein [Saccharothrix sp.]|uniref:RHS repeat-associated core domain-containing protein n=1 Tax=Saccharothrix sp. TaxID=1873460 RepID=UPI0028126019|nr:RHS repeat-associated core domain-containing protein [Saccharothrix sp.]